MKRSPCRQHLPLVWLEAMEEMEVVLSRSIKKEEVTPVTGGTRKVLTIWPVNWAKALMLEVMREKIL